MCRINEIAPGSISEGARGSRPLAIVRGPAARPNGDRLLGGGLSVRFEQAVYGSFPFWNRGYGVLAHSPGCRPEWLAELRGVCQRFGEPPAGSPHVDALFALRLHSGPWLVAGVHSQGCDDRGRPGALAFHALFVGRFAYLSVGGDPFRLKHELRNDWHADDQNRALPAGHLKVWPGIRSDDSPDTSPQLKGIISAITQRHRVIVQSSTPIDALRGASGSSFPGGTRMRAAVATWAFDISNGFDLVALPKLNGLVLSPSDVIMALDPARP